MQLLKEAGIRAGIVPPSRSRDAFDWLRENGYLAAFIDSNGTECFAVTRKGEKALERKRFPAE